MATKKKAGVQTAKRAIMFDITVSGEVLAQSLEDAEEILDFATDTEDLRRRGIRVTMRETRVRGDS